MQTIKYVESTGRVQVKAMSQIQAIDFKVKWFMVECDEWLPQKIVSFYLFTTGRRLAGVESSSAFT